MSGRPFLSIVTPTYNRSKCFAAALDCYLAQTYPLDRREWLILDDGSEPLDEILAVAPPEAQIRYIKVDEKMTIGAKRNRLNAEAAANSIIVCWDDDDYYPPERLAHIAQKFTAQPSIALAGSTIMYIYFQDDGSIWQTGPFSPTHATAGTLAYKKKYAVTHSYDESVRFGEETSFLEKYKNPMIQLDPRKSILCIAHAANTYSKSGMRRPPNKLTSFKLRDFIRSAADRAKYVAQT
jgi:glycosyltransferase involved in cell wall biosynthesis